MVGEEKGRLSGRKIPEFFNSVVLKSAQSNFKEIVHVEGKEGWYGV